LSICCARQPTHESSDAPVADELKPHQISAFAAALRALGIDAVDGYEATLRSNAREQATLDDFAREGLGAATLRKAGLAVTMRDAPDLGVSHGAVRFHVEVARFRRRPKDDVDDKSLRGYAETGLLVDYGDPAGCATQVMRKLVEKAGKFPADRPGVVAIHTDSTHQIEQLEVSMAMSAFNSDLCSGAIPVGPFAGVLCLGGGPPLDGPRRWGNVAFYPASAAGPTLAAETASLLANIAYRITLDDLLH